MDDQVVGVGVGTGLGGALLGLVAGLKVLGPSLAKLLDSRAEMNRAKAAQLVPLAPPDPMSPEDLSAVVLAVLKSPEGQAAISEAIAAKAQRERLEAMEVQLAQMVRIGEQGVELAELRETLNSLREQLAGALAGGPDDA